ncbi:tumor necrosis factor ligand superfamily member 11 [Polypterus senegalus]|uniref:tumor necrosis factor ligand superfamily member 11 n=1 Tax=Polypterus senegalus TaxID=55291 RepID=UPI001965546D|nr:tumor necrosis factor ligand superfamily member 11 [Polypterus senegalus]
MAASSFNQEYKKNPIRMESGQLRLEASHNRTDGGKPIVFCALIIMGLFQVVSNLGILFYCKSQVEQLASNLAPQDNKSHCLSIMSCQKESFPKKEEIKSENYIARARTYTKKPPQRPKCECKNKVEIPSAHLPILIEKNSTKVDDETMTRLHWMSKFGVAHIHNLTYVDGKIKVIQKGLYYVYAKTCFRHNLQVSDELEKIDDGIVLLQNIHHFKYARQMKTLIMKSGSVKHWNKEIHFRFFCIQQGGLFHLHQHDELFVEVNYASLLDKAPEASYFGAFKLRDLE